MYAIRSYYAYQFQTWNVPPPDVFAIDGIAGVFLGTDFIAVTKTAEREWYLIIV